MSSTYFPASSTATVISNKGTKQTMSVIRRTKSFENNEVDHGVPTNMTISSKPNVTQQNEQQDTKGKIEVKPYDYFQLCCG